jgi:hypothetical protein
VVYLTKDPAVVMEIFRKEKNTVKLNDLGINNSHVVENEESTS